MCFLHVPPRVPPYPPASLRHSLSQTSQGVVVMLMPRSSCHQGHHIAACCWLQPHDVEQDERPSLWGFSAGAKGCITSQTGKGAVKGWEGSAVGAWHCPTGGHHTPSAQLCHHLPFQCENMIYLPKNSSKLAMSKKKN